MACKLAAARTFPELLDVLRLVGCHRDEGLAPVMQRLDGPATAAPFHRFPVSPRVGAIFERKAFGCTYPHRDEIPRVGGGVRDRGDAGVRASPSRGARVLDVHAYAASVYLGEREAHERRHLIVGVAGGVADDEPAHFDSAIPRKRSQRRSTRARSRRIRPALPFMRPKGMRPCKSADRGTARDSAESGAPVSRPVSPESGRVTVHVLREALDESPRLCLLGRLIRGGVCLLGPGPALVR